MGLSTSLPGSILKPGVCTSTTRPINAYEGQVIYETDTDTINVWNGTVWEQIRQVGGRANMFRNGGMRIWQRGNGPFSGNATYGVDGMTTGYTGSSIALSRSALTPGSIPGLSLPACASIQVASVAGVSNFALASLFCEGTHVFAGKYVTLSMWAKADAACNMSVEWVRSYGAGGSPSSYDFIGTTQLVPLTTSWQRVQVTLLVPSLAGKTLGTTYEGTLAANLWFDAGSTYAARSGGMIQQSNTFFITGIQVETGSRASAFEVRGEAQALVDCQRYYQRWICPPLRGAGSGTANAGVGRLAMALPVRMLYAPTPSISGPLPVFDGVQVGTYNAISTQYTQADHVSLDGSTTMPAGSIGVGRPIFVYEGNSNYLELTAELS